MFKYIKGVKEVTGPVAYSDRRHLQSPRAAFCEGRQECPTKKKRNLFLQIYQAFITI